MSSGQAETSVYITVDKEKVNITTKKLFTCQAFLKSPAQKKKNMKKRKNLQLYPNNNIAKK